MQHQQQQQRFAYHQLAMSQPAELGQTEQRQPQQLLMLDGQFAHNTNLRSSIQQQQQHQHHQQRRHHAQLHHGKTLVGDHQHSASITNQTPTPTSDQYLHLQPANKNLVYKHHAHQQHQHHQGGARLKQIACYAIQQQQQNSAVQMATSFADHQYQELYSPRPRVSSVSSSLPAVEQGSPLFEPARSTSFSSLATAARASQQRPAAVSAPAASNCTHQVMVASQQHYVGLGANSSGSLSPAARSSSANSAAGSSSCFSQASSSYAQSAAAPATAAATATMTNSSANVCQAARSPSDALNLGINLEQYISKRNERERSRVRNVNDAFDNLKNSLPLDVEKLGKRMSKVEILRTAISYIRNLEDVLGYKQQAAVAATVGATPVDHHSNHHHHYGSRGQLQASATTTAASPCGATVAASADVGGPTATTGAPVSAAQSCETIQCAMQPTSNQQVSRESNEHKQQQPQFQRQQFLGDEHLVEPATLRQQRAFRRQDCKDLFAATKFDVGGCADAYELVPTINQQQHHQHHHFGYEIHHNHQFVGANYCESRQAVITSGSSNGSLYQS